jgi:hypothetical protein
MQQPRPDEQRASLPLPPVQFDFGSLAGEIKTSPGPGAIAGADHDHLSEEQVRADLERAWLAIGTGRQASGDAVGAARSYKKVTTSVESVLFPNTIELFRLTRAFSLLSACPASGGPAPTSVGRGARTALADKAVTSLTGAVAAGFRDWKLALANPDLHALYRRDDFQTLVNDMKIPGRSDCSLTAGSPERHATLCESPKPIGGRQAGRLHRRVSPAIVGRLRLNAAKTG